MQLLLVDLLQEVVDVDALDGHSELPLQLGVLLFEIRILREELVILIIQIFPLEVKQLILLVEL